MPAVDPLWYKDAIIYEAHVRAFADSVGDGVGDFRGLTQKLPYLQDLGITALWLLPFYPSPLKDDGYDIADYTRVHPHYGTLDDFKEFLEAAHDHGIRVITELVINHTSDNHPWFQRARHAPAGSPERDFYVWSDDPEKYKDARVIFKDFEPSNWSWDPVAKAYYWHRFYSHQPDLNFDNAAVSEAIFPLLEYWFEMGVDGMRLDAVPYLYEREDTNCENLPETHQFLKELRARVEARYPDRMFLAEANQWPEDAIAYFGDGDECHMSFHFPLMPRLFMALHQEDRFPIHDIIAQTPAIPENCQWCLFLRNHDELTLEMVTDEERDYMYRAYARDAHARINLGIRHRLAPLLGNDRRRIELMKALLFSLPGTPVLYYGDEIGMGDNIFLGDRNGVRTPMQWSADRNAGFSRANPQKLYLPLIIDPEYHYETVNVEAQQSNPSSLLWWVKRLISLRKKFRAFGRGTLELLRPANPKILAFIRKYEEEHVLVVANLSRFVQYAQLDLKEYAGVVPEELMGRTAFPEVGVEPYLLTLGPHGFIWFLLPTAGSIGKETSALGTGGVRDAAEVDLPVLEKTRLKTGKIRPADWDELERLLPQYLVRNRLLFNRAVAATARILQVNPMKVGDVDVWFLVVRVERGAGNTEDLSMGLTFVADDQAEQLLAPRSMAAFGRISGAEPGLLCDALAVPACCRGLLRGILGGRLRRVEDGEIESSHVGGAVVTEPAAIDDLPLSLQRSERNNTSVVYGESYILKIFRRIEEGINPDLEIGRCLTEKRGYQGAAPVVGFIEYRRPDSQPATLAVLHHYVLNQGTAWQYTIDHLSRFFELVAALALEQPPSPPRLPSMLEPAAGHPEFSKLNELIDSYLDVARMLGQRTAELHLALAENRTDPALAPEPFGKLYQRSLYQSLRNLTGRLCDRLNRNRAGFSETARTLADQVVARHDAILERFRTILDPQFNGKRTRCHGDFHLGQLLYTGKDFVIIDFEGEAGHTIGERRVKRSPLHDIATLVRSFDYALQSVLLNLSGGRGRPAGMIRPEDLPVLEPWAQAWYDEVVRQLVQSYTETIRPVSLLPSSPEAADRLLELLVLEKALEEVDAELTGRIDWVVIPLKAVLRLLGHDPNEIGPRA